MTVDLQESIDTTRTLLRRIADDFSPATFACSLGAEDMVLTDLIYATALPIEVFTLDTGRLPEETHALIDAIGARYGKRPQLYFPQASAVESYVSSHGANAFYASVQLRKACCHMRKVEPLRRALTGKKAWISGLRREQSATRGDVQTETFDAANGLMKFNPLATWSDAEVWQYIRAHGVPYNALHDRHYPSIGCAPCTRAVTAGEDIRSGRWWWEDAQYKECGLHPSTGNPRAAAQSRGQKVVA
ncbi:MAG TPA: phosphoadenylyl-sulfate reductase [Burkholderiales bacterium]|nr:phosphoadenylyl-sulfate reductase [Burkholderiales bacterium]